MTATSSSSTSQKKSAKQKQRPKHSSIIANDESKSVKSKDASSDINAEIAEAVNQVFLIIIPIPFEYLNRLFVSKNVLILISVIQILLPHSYYFAEKFNSGSF